VFGLFNLQATMTRAADRPEPKMVVDGLLPQGLTLLAGGSKLGKSYMSLDIAFGVAAGSPVLGHMVTEQGQVLYLALEDRDDRLVRRMDELEPDRAAWPSPTDLCLVSVNSLGEYTPGALAIAWAEQATNPRLVIIDTITRFGGQGEREGYRADVQWMTRFHKYAQEHDIAVVGVTHTRQMKLEEGEDWFNKITGTQGIVGTADQAMLLDVQRGDSEGMLRVTGRDMPDAEFAIRRVGGFWQVTDQLRGKRGDLSVAIGDFVIQMGETTTAAVAEHFSISSDKASQYLGRLRRNGIISQVKRGTWAGERVAQS
jgi:RecA-family ATPase